MDDPRRITVEHTLAFHKNQLAEHGGQDGTRNLSLLESALSRPRHQFAYGDPTPTIPVLAAAYAFGVAKNHPFLDGNKRTALVVCETFLNINGYELFATNELIYEKFYQLAAGELSEQDFTAWLTANTRQTS